MEQAAGLRLKRSAPPLEFGKFQRRTDFRCEVEGLAVEAEQHAELGVADARCVLQHSLETGSSSPGELLMTCSTSEVAVCCSSASLRSSVR